MTNTSAGWPSSSADKDPKHIPAVAIRTAKFISLPSQPDIRIWLLLASKQLRRIRRVVSGAARVVHRRLTVAVRTHFMGIRLCVFKQANIRWQLLIELPRSQISEIRCGIKRSGHLSVRIPNQVDCRLQLRTGKKPSTKSVEPTQIPRWTFKAIGRQQCHLLGRINPRQSNSGRRT